MSDPGLPERRRDEDGDWHDLVATTCPRCGCRQHQATDDPAIVWEPGRAWDRGCSDRACACHTEPLVGQRRA